MENVKQRKWPKNVTWSLAESWHVCFLLVIFYIWFTKFVTNRDFKDHSILAILYKIIYSWSLTNTTVQGVPFWLQLWDISVISKDRALRFSRTWAPFLWNGRCRKQNWYSSPIFWSTERYWKYCIFVSCLITCLKGKNESF